MKLRIIEHSWRDEKTGGINTYYRVEQLKTCTAGFFRKKTFYVWATVKMLAYESYDGWQYNKTIKFPTLKKAREYAEKLLKEVPEDRVIPYP